MYKEDEGYDSKFLQKNLVFSKRTSKSILNNNAIKFKLTRLNAPITIRYEVIYKNSLRDLRKYFTHDMYTVTDYLRRKKKDLITFEQIMNIYMQMRYDREQMKRLNIDEEVVKFALGSIIHPKEMLKMLKDSSAAKGRVIKIYNYLYKFSLERLSQLLHNKTIMFLMLVYFKHNGLERIQNNQNLNKYRTAYIEAF